MATTSTAELQQLADKLSNELQGTCQSMPEWVEEHEHSQTIMEFFDQDTFLCACCNWWCEMSECEENPDGSGEDICDGCKGTYDEDEEREED